MRAKKTRIHLAANRQFDAFIDLPRRLRCVGERGVTLRAGGQPLVDCAIGVRMQCPANAGAAFARRSIRSGGRAVLLLALRGRPRRVGGSLRWASQFVDPRLQSRDAGVLRRDAAIRQSQPRGQRRDQRVLLGVAQVGGNREQRHPMCRIDPPVAVSSNFRDRVKRTWLIPSRNGRHYPR